MNINSDVLPHVRLRLHLEHPALEACYNEGFDAAQEGADEDGNPYQTTSREHAFWQQGWWAGFYDEPRQFSPSSDADILNDGNAQENRLTGMMAANDDDYRNGQANRWWRRLGQVAGVVAVAVAAMELLDIAV